MLTTKQKELLMFIHSRLQETGVPPSFDEMKEALDLKSKSGIHRLITALEERGFIRRLPHRARAMEIVELPDQCAAGAGRAPASRPASSRAAGGRMPQASPPAQTCRAGSVPLMGRIAAGVPISAIQNRPTSVPPDMVDQGRTFRPRGEGRFDDRRRHHEGDIIIFRRKRHGENGDIVVALVEKRKPPSSACASGAPPSRRGRQPQLRDPDLRPRPGRIQGRLVGLIRRY